MKQQKLKKDNNGEPQTKTLTIPMHQLQLTFISKNGKPLTPQDTETAITRRFLAQGPGIDDYLLVKKVTLPTLDYTTHPPCNAVALVECYIIENNDQSHQAPNSL